MFLLFKITSRRCTPTFHTLHSPHDPDGSTSPTTKPLYHIPFVFQKRLFRRLIRYTLTCYSNRAKTSGVLNARGANLASLDRLHLFIFVVCERRNDFVCDLFDSGFCEEDSRHVGHGFFLACEDLGDIGRSFIPRLRFFFFFFFLKRRLARVHEFHSFMPGSVHSG